METEGGLGMDERKKILLIDDDESICALLRLKLEKTRDYSVVCARDGRSGLEAARRERPDLVILDILMPDAQGGDVAHLMGQDPETRDIPILFLSSLVSEADVAARGGNIGGLPMVSKSSDIGVLTARMKSILDSVGQGGQ